jgi:hypothetical protein
VEATRRQHRTTYLGGIVRARILLAAAVVAVAGVPAVVAHADTGGATRCSNGAVTDPTGDDWLGAGVNTPDTDLTAVTPSYDAATDAITFTATVANLSAVPEAKAFEFYFDYLGTQLDLVAARDITGTTSYELDALNPTTGALTQVATESDGISGSFDDAANTVAITLPLATYNTTVQPAVPLAAGADLSGLDYLADRDVTQAVVGFYVPGDEAVPGCDFVVS